MATLSKGENRDPIAAQEVVLAAKSKHQKNERLHALLAHLNEIPVGDSDFFDGMEEMEQLLIGASNSVGTLQELMLGASLQLMKARYQEQLRAAGFRVQMATFYKRDPEPVSVVWCVRD